MCLVNFPAYYEISRKKNYQKCLKLQYQMLLACIFNMQVVFEAKNKTKKVIMKWREW